MTYWPTLNTDVKRLHLDLMRHDYRLRFQGPVKAWEMADWAIQVTNAQALPGSSFSMTKPLSPRTAAGKQEVVLICGTVCYCSIKDAIKSVRGETGAGIVDNIPSLWVEADCAPFLCDTEPACCLINRNWVFIWLILRAAIEQVHLTGSSAEAILNTHHVSHRSLAPCP